MKITVDESPVGVGKTYRAIQSMVAVPGKYVFAVERVEAINEMVARIFEETRRSNHLPHVERIFGGNGRAGSVTRQIADLPRAMADVDHCIALVTHEGMMMTDFDGFEGWTLIVDEVPTMFALHTYRTATDVAFFEEHYTLTPVNGVNTDWQLVGLTKAGEALDPSTIADCDGHRYLHHFHRRCRDPRMGPVVNLATWQDMAGAGVEWVWWSLFHPSQIAAFSHRLFLGNGFTKSMSHALFDQPDIEWQTVSHMGDRPLRHRHARIVYYSDRPTSLFYLRGDDGQADLTKIGQHIAATTSAPLFWSCNERLRLALDPHLTREAYRLPRQAGTSTLMGFHHAAMFYAAKPKHEVEEAIVGLGSSADQWVSTNEYETILQFLTRTSVRDVSSSEDVTLHVFNRDQAIYLKTFFDSQPHITSSLEKVDLELSTQVKRVPGRKALVLTEDEREAKKLAAREKRKLAMRERRKKVAE